MRSSSASIMVDILPGEMQDPISVGLLAGDRWAELWPAKVRVFGPIAWFTVWMSQKVKFRRFGANGEGLKQNLKRQSGDEINGGRTGHYPG